jgi:NAD(P)-dependent dehydrogenase (short-subunit alcohol dehydrogenase family)
LLKGETMLEFTDKTAVVTGAGGNIGRETARLLAAQGANVCAVDISEDALAETLAVLKDANPDGKHLTHQADVSKPTDVQAYAAKAADISGKIDVFFNNAGIEGATASILEYPDDAFDAVLSVNVKGVFLGLKHVAAYMGEGSAIVNTASVAGLGGSPNMVAYVASKHAVVGMTKTAALEFARKGIRVNAICPAPIQGRMMRSIEDGLGVPESSMAKVIPMRRYGTAEEVAKLVVMLLSDEASYISGGIYPVDGGLRAR